MKKCIKCDLEKDLCEFYKGRAECRACSKEKGKLYYQNNPEKVKERLKLYYQNNLEKQLLKSAFRRAKKKNLPFNLTEQDIVIPTHCPVLNIPLQAGIGTGKPLPSSPTLDRIIPEKGYIKDNIMVVSNKANLIKQNATSEEIIAVGEFYKKLLEENTKNDRSENSGQQSLQSLF